MHNRIILEIFEKYKCPGITVLLQSYRCVSNEQPFLKTTGLYDNLLLLNSLFHFFNFIFSAPILSSLWFPISPSLCCCQPSLRVVEKLLYMYSESEVAQSCPTLSDPVDCSLPGSSVHGFSRQECWSGVPLPSPHRASSFCKL